MSKITDGNKFVGEIPLELGRLSHLTYLRLGKMDLFVFLFLWLFLVTNHVLGQKLMLPMMGR
jgi:hypothetical protein